MNNHNLFYEVWMDSPYHHGSFEEFFFFEKDTLLFESVAYAKKGR